MKCCPMDKNIRKEWKNMLESELTSSKDRIIEISNLCKVFSHPLRIKIALLLNKGDLCVLEIISILKKKQNLVSHHLSIMKKHGVVSSYYQSKYRYYRIKKEAADFLNMYHRNNLHKQ